MSVNIVLDWSCPWCFHSWIMNKKPRLYWLILTLNHNILKLFCPTIFIWNVQVQYYFGIKNITLELKKQKQKQNTKTLQATLPYGTGQQPYELQWTNMWWRDGKEKTGEVLLLRREAELEIWEGWGPGWQEWTVLPPEATVMLWSMLLLRTMCGSVVLLQPGSGSDLWPMLPPKSV